MFASWRHCVRIILGGSHNNGYSRTLSKLQTDNISPGKVALLQGPPFGGELARMSTALFLRLQFGDLFMSTKLDATAAKAVSYVQVASSPGTVSATPPARGESSPPKNSMVPYKSTMPEFGSYPFIQKLTPRSSLPVFKTIVAYLLTAGCYKDESACKYSHSHKLTETQISAMRYYCRQTPCDTWKLTNYCQFGDECIRGHDCPDNFDGHCRKVKGAGECKLAHPKRGSYI